MKLSELLALESKIVSVGRILPVVDGVSFLVPPIFENNTAIFNLPDNMHFGVEIAEQDNQIWLSYWLENPPSPLYSFGLRFENLGNLRAFLRNGYFSWDGSSYLEPTDTSQQGYAMTQLLPRFGAGSLVIGFDRHDRFQHRFTCESRNLTIETLWDAKTGRCQSENLIIFEHPEVENGLRAWAHIVAKAMNPRLSAPQIAGWCSWYNLYAYISEDIILEHLHGAEKISKREDLPLSVFQIDDGFTPEMGDWLDVKPQFPRSMKPLLDEIRGAGFIPGLWIAPFMVGNRSRLYQAHPEWVVTERATGKPLAHMKFYEEFRWHKRSEEYYILDVTHPAALDYIRQVFRTWRDDWGCDYFKTDFMHFGSEYGADKAVWHQSGLTRIEIWRIMAEMIREAIGDALWLGCGCPLWASVGLVDAVRIGRDVGVQWAGNQSAQSLLRDQATRNFANHILWQADPDCILLRDQFHYLTDAEVEALAIYAGMSGGLVMTSDALHELSPARLNLFKSLLNFEQGGCEFPLLGQSDSVIVQVRQMSNTIAVFILNPTDQTIQRTYPLEMLKLPAERYLDGQAIHQLAATLPAHHGKLWLLLQMPS